MTSRNLRSSIILAVSAGALLLAPGAGCSKKKKPEPPPPPPPRPVEAPPPEPVNMTQVRASLRGLDARVQFDQDYAPTDRELATQVLTFCSALARKDADALRPMLDADSRQILGRVEQSWDQSEIQAVRVVNLSQGGGGRVQSPLPTPRSSPRPGARGPVDLGPILEEAFASADMSQVPDSLRPMVEQASQQMLEQLRSLPPDQVRAVIQAGLTASKNMTPQQRRDFDASVPGDGQALLRTQIRQAEALLAKIDAALAEAASEAPIDPDPMPEVELAEPNPSSLSAVFVTAVQDQDDAFVLMWELNKYADGWVFSSMPATDHTFRSVRDWDGLTITDYQAEALALDTGPEEDEGDLPARPAPPPTQGGGGARPGSTTSGG